MERIATFDLGTTALKCVVIDEEGNILFSGKKNITTYNDGLFIEQDPNEWWNAFLSLSKEFDTSIITSLIFSGQMQDLICLDDTGNILRKAILYNDQRADKQVSIIPKEISRMTSIEMNGSIPLPKLLWLKENEKGIFDNIKHILISSKDYIVYKLTGKYSSDVTSMATSGMMDITTKKYVNLSNLINEDILPNIKYADEVVGNITGEVSKLTGYNENAKVFAGSGDAGATTLASGVSALGDFNINLGTSGWIATVSEKTLPNVFNLAAINRDLYINVIPVLNAASVHAWCARMIYPEEPKKYDLLENLLKKKGSNLELLCLPYLVGERFPIADKDIRGAYIGLTPDTSKTDLARAALEGVGFSLKQGLEKIDMKSRRISLIGGGAAEPTWCQIFADIFDTPITVYGNSEVLPSMALAAVVMFHNGQVTSYKDFVEKILDKQEKQTYLPNEVNVKHYNHLFPKFKRLYPVLSSLNN